MLSLPDSTVIETVIRGPGRLLEHAGHDPLVAERFGHPADARGVIRITR